MRSRFALSSLALVAATLLSSVAGAQERAWRLPGLDGGELSSADVERGSTVMVVWASWSPRCRDIAERVAAVRDIVGSRARVVTVDFQEEPEEVRGFLAGKSLGAPVFLDRDGSFSKDHHVSTLPGLVVYRDGEVTYQGKLPDAPRQTLDRALD